MWSTLSASRWILLLSLAAVMLFTTSEGQPFHQLPCCRNLGYKTSGKITECYEQKSRSGCRVNAFLIKKQNRTVCIHPDSPWIKDKLARGLQCSPDVSFPK